MSNANYDINVMRNIILESQHLLKKSSDSIEDIVSDYTSKPIYDALVQKKRF